ncbi:inner membrane protein [Algoriphagus aquaeductus]|uniref:Inner membrane protein n=1 Tax=Algoriphagus aquaeductus TaxID=475299 RepID=A0A326S704_9BACT|nr:YgjV family protein [Algoriphagus aquaeductus]PZV87272.1 inner membrane protein [Algoriphagus aquaeductus]
MNWVAETMGYLAIGAGFYAISKKDMAKFRVWHLISSVFYTLYGFFLMAFPLIIASVVFCVIHVYHLRKLRLDKVKVPNP